MKETRAQFVPPPPPRADLQDLALWAKRMSVLLPAFLNNLQQMLLEASAQLYDIGVPVSPSDVTGDLEAQTAETGSAGTLADDTAIA